MYTQSTAGVAVININGNVTTTGQGGIIGQNTANHTGILNINGTLTSSQTSRLIIGNNVDTVAGIVNVNSGGTLRFTDSASTAKGLILGRDKATGTLNLSGGTLETDLVVQDSDSQNNGTAIVNLDGGTIVTTATLANDLFYKSKSASSYTVNILTGGATIDTQGNGITIGAGTNKVGLSGSVGDGGLTKKGTGALTLGMANTYYGKTVIDAGTLKLTGEGTLANTSEISVKNSGSIFDVSTVTGGYTLASGKTLSGNGTVVGSITIAGTISPGNSIGTITFSDAVSVTETGVIVIEINGANSYDQVVAQSGITFKDGALVELKFTEGYVAELGDQYTIFGSSSSVVDYEKANIISNLGAGYTFAWDANGVIGVAAIPEPSTYALLGGIALIGIAVVTQRRKRG